MNNAGMEESQAESAFGRDAGPTCEEDGLLLAKPRLAGEGLERLIEPDSAEERQAQEHAKGEPHESPHGVPPSLCCLRFLA